MTAFQQEIDGLEALERSMTSNLTTMRARREADVFSQTLNGRMLNGATAIFGVYCIYRMLVVRCSLFCPKLALHFSSRPYHDADMQAD